MRSEETHLPQSPGHREGELKPAYVLLQSHPPSCLNCVNCQPGWQSKQSQSCWALLVSMLRAGRLDEGSCAGMGSRHLTIVPSPHSNPPCKWPSRWELWQEPV